MRRQFVIYSPSDRSAKFLVGNNVGAPSSFSAVQNVNAIQRDVVYILRNAYEIVLRPGSVIIHAEN